MSKVSRNILVLYSRLPNYMYNCLEQYAVREKQNITIVRHAPDENAPFHFSSTQLVEILDYDSKEKERLFLHLSKKEYSIILVSGWITKTYWLWVFNYRKLYPKIKALILIDNIWNNSLQQIVLAKLLSFFTSRLFDGAWVAGSDQANFARALRFKSHEIYKGVYCADTDYFSRCYTDFRKAKEVQVPKQILFVGRLLKWKGIMDLINAFENAKQITGDTDWTLKIVGNGELQKEIIKVNNKSISYQPFIPPSELRQVIQESCVFCLPSHFEHWGVVVHEFSCSGLILLLSDGVSSKESFLKPEFNGFLFKSNNIIDLTRRITEIFSLTDKTLIQMMRNSHSKGMSYKVEDWISKLRRM